MRAGAASTGCCTSTSAGYHCQPVHISRLAQLRRPARAQRLVCVSDRAARHAVLRLLGCQRPCRSARRVQALPPRSESDAETDVQSVDAGGSLDEAVPSIWKDLLCHQNLELSRASSVADAHVLRRKGHLKEQDKLIQFIIDLHETHTPREVMEKVERWILEHREDPKRSRLKRLVPTLGSFHTGLKLTEALEEYDLFSHISQRRYVPPNFAEIRHILNISQVHASAEHMQLITFDADGTLYEDGHHFEQNNKMIKLMIDLLRSNVKIAIVTAAGYPGEPEKFEQRLQGLLDVCKAERLPPALCERFFLMGGECNYLLRLTPEYRLEFVPFEEWCLPEMKFWSEDLVTDLLDDAQSLLVTSADRLRLPVEVIRKERAVGIVPKQPTIYEVLEELTLTVQTQLEAELPFCAFNGGNDVFVDVGNKSIGLEALMKYLNCESKGTLHVGDRFTSSGNDSAARTKCSILWVANPDETAFFVRMLLRDVRAIRFVPYLE